jgi:NADH:ubiquinone oxidoreductase subunit 4 (subunit M)
VVTGREIIAVVVVVVATAATGVEAAATIDIMDTTVEEVVTTTEIKDSITEITTGVIITGITTIQTDKIIPRVVI